MAPSAASLPLENYWLFGQVEVADAVAIAPRTLLAAEPESSLTVAAGVCIGADVVIQARGGALVIEAGANIGSGVLIVGRGRIGRSACIGSGSTLVNPDIAPETLVPSGTLQGDRGRQPEAFSSETTSSETTSSGASQPQVSAPESTNGSASAGSTNGGFSHVYGKNQVNQLLNTLFPHRQPLNSSSEQ